MPFDYPDTPHHRLHAPGGYRDYRNYKDWLRDEFRFRCVYCLRREAFLGPFGENQFGIDHVRNQAEYPHLRCDYGNLVYSCNDCNALKRDHLLIDPGDTAFADHLQVEPDGGILGLTTEGRRLILILRLDSPRWVEWRARWIKMRRILRDHPESWSAELARPFFRYPAVLPDLGALNPPENLAPGSIEQSCHRQRLRGELSEEY